jgi:creatinine amidohydrolase
MRSALAAVALLLAALPAAAQSSLYLEALTSPEVSDAIRAGKTTVLIPIGGTEWNGDYIVLGKHNARAGFLAHRIAERLGDALVAPVVAYVPEGTINPPTQHMKHPGTITVPADAFEKTLASVARSLKHHGFKRVVLLGDHGGYIPSLRVVAHQVDGVIVPEAYYREMEHAGADDTAATLAVDPALVRDAKAASPDHGSKILDAIVERTVKALRAAN